ncbi:MAG: Crp/Fnr family transcriptional regulator [Pseudonocardiales bacterium]|nr:Crp/Fnr family transcriptional regulator [Pseudonocardiales bacterium]
MIMDEQHFAQGAPLLTKEETLELERVGSTLRRQAGHTFMREGEDSDFVLLIRKGTVKVISGKPERIIALRGPGETVGEMGVLLGKPRSATVVAWDDVTVLHVSDIEWRRFVDEHPRAKDALIVELGNRLDEASKKIGDSDLAVERRLAKALAELVERGLTTTHDDGTRSVRLAQKDLATLTGSSVEAVKKAVKVFKDNGLVDTGRLVLCIRDVAALADVADGKPLASG